MFSRCIEFDLDRSFADLKRVRGFFAEAQRGHIRSQQLRFEEAWQYFDRAQELLDNAEENIPNLIHGFLLHLWCFENAVVEAPLIESRNESSPPWIPELHSLAMADHPEIKLVLDMRLHAEALLRLHLGQWDVSRKLYEQLIEDNRRDCQGSLGLYYSGLAASQHNLGLQHEAQSSLENSGFAILAGGRTIHRARAAVTLCALHSYMGDSEKAWSWRKFLDSLCCARGTRDVFLERGRILLDRCARTSSLLVL